MNDVRGRTFFDVIGCGSLKSDFAKPSSSLLQLIKYLQLALFPSGQRHLVYYP